MSSKKKNIACLESLWDNKTENRLNVLPILELISRNYNVKFSHLSCNTESEFQYNLKLLCKRNYSILYLGFHGSGGKIYLHDETEINFTKLAEMMNCKFTDWIVHFGSCGVLRRKKDLAQFVENTEIRLATGFERTVGWIESAAFELLLFQAFLDYQSPKVACRSISNKFPDLVEQTGFCFYPES